MYKKSFLIDFVTLSKIRDTNFDLFILFKTIQIKIKQYLILKKKYATITKSLGYLLNELHTPQLLSAFRNKVNCKSN